MQAPLPISADVRRRAVPCGREGAILALVLVVMVVLAFVGVGLLGLSSATGMEAGRSIGTVQAFWTAEAGLERVKTIGLKRRRPFAKIVQAGSPSGFLYGSNALVGTTSQGAYAVDVLEAPGWTNANQALKKYIIVSRGTANNGTKHRVSVRTEIETFASYMHSTDLERTTGGGLIYFGPADVIDGPVYVNDRLNVYGTARFLQSVASATNSVNYQWGASIACFEGGLVLNVPPLSFTNAEHIADVKTEALSGGLSLTSDFKFDFRSDGSFTYVPAATNAPIITNYVSAVNGAIYVDGNAWVQGVVDGEVTMAVQNSIYISNNVTYASAQSPNPWQGGFNPAAVDDSLGLIASNRVQIVGANAVSIHAAILVTSGDEGFGAANRYVPIGAPPINLYGSLSQKRRGVVGQISTPMNGFTKNYKYDSRFHADAPPNFPYSVYVFSRWEQHGY